MVIIVSAKHRRQYVPYIRIDKLNDQTGVETVAYTYLIHHITAAFPKIACSNTMATRVAEVKCNAERNHEVPFPAQMTLWCEHFVDSTRQGPGTAASPSVCSSYNVAAPSVPALSVPFEYSMGAAQQPLRNHSHLRGGGWQTSGAANAHTSAL